MKISRRFLGALEEGDWERLPGKTYGRAFARTYGRFLGVDVQPFLPAAGAAGLEAEPAPAPAAAKGGRPGAAALIAVALVVLAATFGWIVYASQSSAPVPTPQKTAKKTQTPKTPSPPTVTVTATGSGTLFGWPATDYQVSPGPAKITITFSGPCWIKVVADGAELAATTYRSGTYTFSASQDLQVLFGNPPAVSATLSGTPLALGPGRSPVAIQASTAP